MLQLSHQDIQVTLSRYRFYFTGANQIQLNPAKTYLIWLIKSTGLEYVADLYNGNTFSVHYTLLSDNPYANGKMITFAFQRQYDYTISSAIWFDPARIGAGTTTYPNYDIKMQVNTLSATKNSVMYSGVFKTNAAGLLDNFFLESNLNLKNNVISGISNPSVSTDLANKAYVDAAVTLQSLYNQDPDGSGATITTTTTDGALIIGGTERLQVTASSGVSVSQILLVSSSMTTGTLTVGNGGLVVSSAGTLTNIKGVSYNFPATDAASANLVLFNDEAREI
jgi:hypothetical protein